MNTATQTATAPLPRPATVKFHKTDAAVIKAYTAVGAAACARAQLTAHISMLESADKLPAPARRRPANDALLECDNAYQDALSTTNIMASGEDTEPDTLNLVLKKARRAVEIAEGFIDSNPLTVNRNRRRR